MTNRSGGERGKENPKKGKSKCLAPGKLIDNRNSMFRKKSTFVQSSQATTTPTPPTWTPSSAPTPSLAPTPSVASTLSPALNPLPVRAAAVPRTTPILRIVPVPQAIPPLQTTLSSTPNHASTSEVFKFMPTPGLNI
ncbi:unnamed protein product [Lathyrus sativus]|nr:unnamed protein product [Lathyrus sativus]